MSKIMVNMPVNISAIEYLIKQMPTDERIKLINKLERATWAERLDKAVSKIRKQFKKAHISDKEITRICESTRKDMYEKRADSNLR